MPVDRRVEDKGQEKVAKLSRFDERTEKNLEYICDSCSHCGWSIRSSMQFRGGADQAKHRQEKYRKSLICCIAGISENIKKSSGSPWLVSLTRDLNKLNPANNIIMLCALSIITIVTIIIIKTTIIIGR